MNIMIESSIDLLSTCPNRSGGYRSIPSYSHVTQASDFKLSGAIKRKCNSYRSAVYLKELTGAHGVMIGRSAIRNPWIFRQIREFQMGSSIFMPTGGCISIYCGPV